MSVFHLKRIAYIVENYLRDNPQHIHRLSQPLLILLLKFPQADTHTFQGICRRQLNLRNWILYLRLALDRSFPGEQALLYNPFRYVHHNNSLPLNFLNRSCTLLHELDCFHSRLVVPSLVP